jgi:hypothetical protein
MLIKLTSETGKRVAIPYSSSSLLEECTTEDGSKGTRIKTYGDPIVVREPIDDLIKIFDEAEVRQAELYRPRP